VKTARLIKQSFIEGYIQAHFERNSIRLLKKINQDNALEGGEAKIKSQYYARVTTGGKKETRRLTIFEDRIEDSFNRTICVFWIHGLPVLKEGTISGARDRQNGLRKSRPESVLERQASPILHRFLGTGTQQQDVPRAGLASWSNSRDANNLKKKGKTSLWGY